MSKLTKRFVLIAGAFALLGAAPAFAGGNSFSLGLEGFHDEYKESDLGNTDRGNSGSFTAYFARQLTKRTFFALDGRASYGTDAFSSPTGNVSGIPQWEFELRSRVGYSFPLGGGEMSPYIGLGWRYNMSQGKGYITDQYYEDYDRSTSQFYVPIGASYSYAFDGGWSITPQAEADIMFYGNADSRLTNVWYGAPVTSQCSPSCNGYQFFNPASTDQGFGIGGRGELMFGKDMGDYSLQAGPFVRYWYVPQSDKVPYQNVTGGPGPEYSVPKNTTMQAGVALRILFH